MWHEGKSLEEIGCWIGRSTSTVRALLKRAHNHCLSKGQPWPTKDGLKICDIPHPMASGDNVLLYRHVRQYRTALGRFYCPVCRRTEPGKPLRDVFDQERGELLAWPEPDDDFDVGIYL